MLSIIFNNAEGTPEVEYHWHCNAGEPEKIPASFLDQMINRKLILVEVQANFDELIWIRDNFSNLPWQTTKRTTCWRGDFARFIVDHLPVDYKR